MANSGLGPQPKYRSVLTTGAPNAAGLVYTYVTGTSTPKGTQVSRTGAANANPVVLDANGEADIWFLTGQYKIVEKTTAGVTLRTTDEFSAAGDLPFVWTESGANIYRSSGQVYIGATSGGETLTVVGTVSVSSTLAVTGTTNLISGMLTVSGAAGVVVNDGANSGGDFRCESSADTHFLFLDASAEILHIGGTGTGDIAVFSATACQLKQATSITANTDVTGTIAATGNITSSAGNLSTTTIGKGIHIATGTNARLGGGSLVNGTLTVANSSYVAGDILFYNRLTKIGTAVGYLSATPNYGVGFTINSTLSDGTTLVDDDSTVQWLIIDGD